ncbi:MAG TPA: 50S ribosomal protein L31 [Candidatus Magasanikbacteria bacterium]|nr:MAG: 50S ribosomal protein L31 [Candidatus Magasanikbacteria bacterium RIFCSPLOWO2_02_FULL_47_16]OGH79882.1 MAG: 50S ribosomal protein L31 [Candidatus Magasanikbacteria bacterium RIFCSPHIGHO2_02_FULL_48_18]HAZ28992.1 50S ribosomal protein L31 [Candidatus Magasanikbacteria bacterium]
MKQDIHPQLHPVVFVDTSCNAEFVTTSTMTSEEKRDINGIPHSVIHLEISSASHPFYTGKQILVDTARRVEKFEQRMKQKTETASVRKGKKAKRLAKQQKADTEAQPDAKKDASDNA